jgi:hypothetical protein
MAKKERPISGLELLVSGILVTAMGRLIGKYVLGEEWVRRSERIDSRADELAEERKRKRHGDDTLPGFDEMLESRHRSLHSLSIPSSGGAP